MIPLGKAVQTTGGATVLAGGLMSVLPADSSLILA